VYLVVNESVGRVHLASGLAARAFESVFAFERFAAAGTSHVTVHACWELRCPQPCEPSQLSRINLTCNIRRHVYGRLILFGHKVLSDWYLAAAGLDSDFDVSIDRLASDRGRAEARVDSRCLARSLIFDTVILQTCDVTVGSTK